MIDHVKNHRVYIRLNDDELKRIEEKAKLTDKSVGQFLRWIGLNADIKLVCPTNDVQILKRKKVNIIL